jgi:glycosyltransferase involved in cell wall biosynthesis
LTSEYEGFGLVVAEAMSQGVAPVVYNSFETAHDLVTDGYNGALIEKPFSVQTFTKVMYALMANADNRSTLSINGKITSEKYLVDCIVKEWYQLIDN